MYQEIFNFNGRPFTMAPFVKHFFQESPVKQSLDQISESISRDAGPAVVIGEHGTGKSLLLALLAEQYQQRFKVISLSCGPMSERRDLLQVILYELKQPYHDLSEGELRLSLIDFIKPTENCPNGVLLLIDDAQSLTPDIVDELRMISNFVRDGIPRVRVVLCGTSRFEEVLTEPKLEPFNQRLSTRCFLGNLTREQTHVYIVEHVSRVGGDASRMFEKPTADAIHAATCGCPRFVNQLAEQCMIYAATHGSMVVEPSMVEPAWAQVQGLPTSAPTESPVPESNEENWTVIEFGTLDDGDTGSFSEPVQTDPPEAAETDPVEPVQVESALAGTPTVTVEAIESTNAELIGESVERESEPDPSPDSGQVKATEGDPLWSDVGSDDPFVAPESGIELATESPEQFAAEASANDFFENADEPSGLQNEDGYSYQPLDAELDSEQDSTEEEQDAPVAIPTEFVELNRDQEDIWAAAQASLDRATEAPTTESEHQLGSESPESSAEEASDTSEASPILDSVLPAIPVAAAAASIASPFAEAFETEESVANDFSEQVAEQNTSSMQVTGEQLDHLLPTNDGAEGDNEIPVVSVVQDTPPAYPTAAELAESPELSVEQELPVAELANTDSEVESETESETHGAGPVEYTADELAAVFSSRATEENTPEEDTVSEPELPAALPVAESATPADTASEFTASSIDTLFLNEPPHPSTHESPGLSAEGTHGVPSEPAAEGYHEHEVHESTDEIQKQANEILNAIRIPDADAVVEATEAVAPEPMVSPAELGAAESAPEENAEISEAQRILSEILEQKKLIGGQVAPADNQSNPSSADSDYPQSVPMRQTYPSADAEPVTVADSSQPQDAPTGSIVPPNGLTPDGSQTSIGRAERMDYERLFEQLRDSGNQS